MYSLFLLLALMMSPVAKPQTHSEDQELTLVKIKQDRVATILENNNAALYDRQKSTGSKEASPYTIDIGVYGMYEPSIFPEEEGEWFMKRDMKLII